LPDLATPQNEKLPDLATPVASGEKRLFVTSTAYSATALATVCQDSADAAGLGGLWKPWLSTSLKDAIDSIQGTGPWKLLDGTVAFKNHAQLATQPSSPINITEDKQTLTNTGYVWTGTTNGGRDSGNSCSGWTTTQNQGTVGYPGLTDNWTFSSYRDCNTHNHVYCFEQ
jgi:hypothetical protein